MEPTARISRHVHRAALVLAMLLLALPASAQRARQGGPLKPNEIPDHLKLKGDPAEKEAFAEGWVPPSPERADGASDGPIVRAPLWCDVLEKEGHYAADAKLPPRVRRLLGRPERDITSWMEGDPKLEPVLIGTEHARMIVALPTDRRGYKALPKHERAWLDEWFPGKLRVSRPLLKEHRAILFGLRYLQMEARFLSMIRLLEGTSEFQPPLPAGHLGSRGRSEIFVLPKLEAYQEFGRHFFGAFGHKTSWWYNKVSDNMISSLHADELKDEQLAARFDYAIAQHLVYHYRGFYHKLPPWMVAGIAHHFELIHRRSEPTFAAMGVPTDWGKKFSDKNWRRVVRMQVSGGKEIPLAKLGLQKDMHELKPEWHPQSWSMVNFMLGVGPDRFRRFVDEMKTKPPEETLIEVQFRAFERAYGIDMLTMHHAWREWVLRTYR